jgi:hypothetical protein
MRRSGVALDQLGPSALELGSVSLVGRQLLLQRGPVSVPLLIPKLSRVPMDLGHLVMPGRCGAVLTSILRDPASLSFRARL